MKEYHIIGFGAHEHDPDIIAKLNKLAAARYEVSHMVAIGDEGILVMLLVRDTTPAQRPENALRASDPYGLHDVCGSRCHEAQKALRGVPSFAANRVLQFIHARKVSLAEVLRERPKIRLLGVRGWAELDAAFPMGRKRHE